MTYFSCSIHSSKIFGYLSNAEADTRCILEEKVFLRISQIHKKAPVPESLFYQS